MPTQKKSAYKNAARSRHLIKQAFAEMLNEKDITKITVTDIVERANISRGTFYAHYLDIYDLFSAIQNNIIEAVDEKLAEIGMLNLVKDPTQAVTEAIDFLDKNKPYYKLFITSSYSDSFIFRIIDRFADKYTDEIRTVCPQEMRHEVDTFISYTIGGLKNTVVRWLDGSLDITSDECKACIIRMMRTTVPEDFKKLLA